MQKGTKKRHLKRFINFQQKKKGRGKEVPLLCGFSHHHTPSTTLRTRHTHENNYRHSLHTDSFLLLEILYTFTSQKKGDEGVFGSVAYDKSVLIFLEWKPTKRETDTMNKMSHFLSVSRTHFSLFQFFWHPRQKKKPLFQLWYFNKRFLISETKKLDKTAN